MVVHNGAMGGFEEEETARAERTTEKGAGLGPVGAHQLGADAVDAALLVGRDLSERYELGAMLGHGGMGEVLRCHDRRIGRDVALKRLLSSEQSGAGFRRFLREARVQGRLQHPSVVPVHDLGVDEHGNPYFVMKRVSGWTLGEILEKQAEGNRSMRARFPRHTLLTAFARACLTLEYAHARGVVHRDLKPANLMLGDFGELYVLDWGVAQVAEVEEAVETELQSSEADLTDVASEDTQEGALLGTLGYASPEQCLDAATVDPATDIYAMGVILYELLTRRRFIDPTLSGKKRLRRTLMGVDARPSEQDPSIAPELDAICKRATEVEPEDRYGSMRELHDALERYLAGERSDELRETLATEHAERAERALAAPLSLEAREGALADIGRAIALGGERAIELFFRLVRSPSAETLEAVDGRLQEIEDERVRRALYIGGINYSMWLLALPLLVWMGIRDAVPVAAIGGCMLAAALLCAVFARRGSVGRVGLYMVFLLNLGAIVAGSRISGPFIFVPQVVIAALFAYSLMRQPRDRLVFALLGAATVFAPLALERLGVWPPSYVFHESGVQVVPNAVSLPELPTLVVLSVITLANIASATLFCGTIRQELDRVQSQSVLQAWHLEKLFGFEKAVKDSVPPPA